MNDVERQESLNRFFSRKILSVFAEFEIDEYNKGLSCKEAVAVLEHTIALVKKDIPLDFTHPQT